MYKQRLGELKKEQKELRGKIGKHQSEIRKLERRLGSIMLEIKYLRALDAYQRTGKALPALAAEPGRGRRGRQGGRRRGRRGKRGLSLTKLIPEALAEGAMTTHELIEALTKMGWKTSAARPYPVVYNSAANLVKQGKIKKVASGKFAVK